MQPVRVAIAVFLVCGGACQSASEPPLVEFGPALVVGKWQPEDPSRASQTSPPTAAGSQGLEPEIPTSPGEPAEVPPAVAA
ncbi:MAG TPA: hypothetical protein VJV78_06105, partial [Polyangiales bacterium]|nr:hypothetical protein [Polyangiales bacterium]